MSVLRSPLINPLRSPLYSPLLSSVAWWGNYNPSTGFAYDFKLNRYMSQGKSTGITQVVTEGRSTDAYVLDGGGNYILRSANEPAQANGHGLDGFDEVDNIITLLAAPTDLTGVTFLQSGSGGTLTLEDQTTELGAIGLATLTGGKAYFVDNTSGDGSVFLSIANPTFDSVANDFNLSAILRGTSGVVLRTGGGDYTQIGSISETLFSRIETNNASRIAGGASTVDSFFVGVPIGEWAYLSLPQVVVGGDFHVPLVPPSSTRDADDTRVVQGQGPELVPFPDFSSLAGWTFSGSAVDTMPGDLTVTNLAAGEGKATIVPAVPIIAGVTYEVTTTISLNVSGQGVVVVGGQRVVVGSAGTNTVTVVAGGGSTVQLGTNSGTVGAVVVYDNVSVKAVTIAPGFTANPNELTFRVDWDGVAVGTGTFRHLFEIQSSTGKRVALLLPNAGGALWFGGDQTGAFQRVIVPGFDDGLSHTAICYLNRTSSEFKISIDGGTTVSGTLTGAVPPNLDDMLISRSVPVLTSINGTNCRIQVSEGDFFEAFRDSSAGFF